MSETGWGDGDTNGETNVLDFTLQIRDAVVKHGVDGVVLSLVYFPYLSRHMRHTPGSFIGVGDGMHSAMYNSHGYALLLVELLS